MRQLPLEFRLSISPDFGSFVVGANAEAVSRLRALGSPRAFDAIYLWGAPGSGRSHLLAATAAAARTAGRAVANVRRPAGLEHPDVSPGALVIADDVEDLPEAGQIELFRAINTAPMAGLALLVAGGEPPARLAVREDLRTRLAAMLAFEIKPLTDQDKGETLSRRAAARGLNLDREVIDYLLRHARRDISSLLGVLDELDRASLEQKRAVTVAMVKSVLATAVAPQAAGSAARPG
jgi:DnaA family protein